MAGASWRESAGGGRCRSPTTSDPSHSRPGFSVTIAVIEPGRNAIAHGCDKADLWFLRQHPDVLNAEWTKDRVERDNAIDEFVRAFDPIRST